MSKAGITKKTDVKEASAEKRAFALRLRKDGHSYAAIGRLLHTQFGGKGTEFTPVYARKLVVSAIKEIYRDDVTDLIRLELERLDDMQIEALEVLRNEHVLVSAGYIVRQTVMDENNHPVFNPRTGLPASVPIRDDGPRLAAIDRLLKIQERRARLLGLDKPTKVAPTTPDGDKSAAPFVIVASKEDLAL